MQTDVGWRETPSRTAFDRRQNRRYRISTPITIWLADGTAKPAMTLEISESGLSVCTDAALVIGQQADLGPLGNERVSAVVRRVMGRVCGLEFVQLTPEQVHQIQSICFKLPIFYGGRTGI
jgi:hypothetical protein